MGEKKEVCQILRYVSSVPDFPPRATHSLLEDVQNMKLSIQPLSPVAPLNSL